eukprot:Em0001g3081a
MINTGDALPIHQQARRLPFHQRDMVQKMIKGMLEQGIIEPADGSWTSPIVLAKKKDGSFRFCVDYRRVNDVTKKDVHPIPRIDDTLDTLAGAQWFSTIDLASGYWQVEMDPSDKEKTTYVRYPFWSPPVPCNALWFDQCTQHLSKVDGLGISWFKLQLQKKNSQPLRH